MTFEFCNLLYWFIWLQKRAKCDWLALKLLFLPQNLKIHPEDGGFAPSQTISVIRWSFISLFNTGPNSDNFSANNFSFGSSPLPLNKILVALLVAFTAADRIFKRLNGPDRKRGKKRCRPYTSLFSNINTKLLKQRTICSRKTSVFMCKSSVYFSAPHFRLEPPHFGCSRTVEF